MEKPQQVLLYSQWKDTAYAIHMLLQMMGKIKLDKQPKQPEWNHSFVTMTAWGFTTGLIQDTTPHSFEIVLDLRSQQVSVRCTNGKSAAFPLRSGASVAEYYEDFLWALKSVRHTGYIWSRPQEVADVTLFEESTRACAFDGQAALQWLEDCAFAQNALLGFAAPLRCKKLLPTLFWGTFDMTTVLFSGEEAPFPGDAVIERVAFDEKLMEFGYWPGDDAQDEPSFFALPYPFVQTDYTGETVRPEGAFFSTEKKEWFLPLRAVLAQDDPQKAVQDFCTDTFQIIAQREDWKNRDWFVKPLRY